MKFFKRNNRHSDQSDYKIDDFDQSSYTRGTYSSSPATRRLRGFRVFDSERSIGSPSFLVWQSLITVLSLASFALSVVAIYPRADWYLFRMDNTDINPAVLFRNVILESSNTIPDGLTLNDTALSQQYRANLVRWCAGHYDDEGHYAEDFCHKWTWFDVGKVYAQTAEYVGEYNVTASDKDIVYYPSDYPSTSQVKSRSSKGRARAIVAVALLGVLVLISVPTLVLSRIPRLVVVSGVLTTFQFFILVIALIMMIMACDYTSRATNSIVDGFNDSYDTFGIILSRGNHFFIFAGLSAGLVGVAAILSFVVYVFYVL